MEGNYLPLGKSAKKSKIILYKSITPLSLQLFEKTCSNFYQFSVPVIDHFFCKINSLQAEGELMLAHVNLDPGVWLSYVSSRVQLIQHLKVPPRSTESYIQVWQVYCSSLPSLST